MLRVQIELLQFKKKSSEFFQNMKKDEKMKMLESSVKWLRDELVALASNIEQLRTGNRTLRQRVRFVEDEKKQMEEQIQTLTNYNVMLKRTVEKLKSPEFIQKYEKAGQEKAQERMLRNKWKQSEPSIIGGPEVEIAELQQDQVYPTGLDDWQNKDLSKTLEDETMPMPNLSAEKNSRNFAEIKKNQLNKT